MQLLWDRSRILVSNSFTFWVLKKYQETAYTLPAKLPSPIGGASGAFRSSEKWKCARIA
jgi:hypothetical protein